MEIIIDNPQAKNSAIISGAEAEQDKWWEAGRVCIPYGIQLNGIPCFVPQNRNPYSTSHRQRSVFALFGMHVRYGYDGWE